MFSSKTISATSHFFTLYVKDEKKTHELGCDMSCMQIRPLQYVPLVYISNRMYITDTNPTFVRINYTKPYQTFNQ